MSENTTQEQRLDYLVEEFKADSGEYKDLQTPADMEGKRRILRSLMNIRMPGELPDSVLKVQNEYLSGRAEEKGIVRLSDIPVIRDGLSIWQGDITRLEVDAIVNAANSQIGEVLRTVKESLSFIRVGQLCSLVGKTQRTRAAVYRIKEAEAFHVDGQAADGFFILVYLSKPPAVAPDAGFRFHSPFLRAHEVRNVPNEKSHHISEFYLSIIFSRKPVHDGFALIA